MEKAFRYIAYLEGTSFLLLLGIAMPLKYIYGQPQMVRSVGWVHGLLFMLYVGVLAYLSSEKTWPLKKTLLGFAAGVIPFGPFLFDRFLLHDSTNSYPQTLPPQRHPQ